MADTFSDMAADSPVPVLSGTHSDNTSTDSKVLSSCCCCFLSHTFFNGCGMGPLLVLVSHCFRENVVVRLCSLDNLLQKNVIVFFFGNQISKWRSFEEKKRAIFDLLFTIF